MQYSYFSHNGTIQPISQAVIPLSNIEYSYGFGVYESVRVSKGQPYFLDEHCQRLLESAWIIGLEHSFTSQMIQNSICELIAKMNVETCNVKVLLIGGETPDLYIFCLNPLFPDRKLYKTGVHCITREYERPFPHAKTLNMLPSYLAFREAKKADAYDALLVNSRGNLIEGTRTNFFVIKDKTIISPPASDILLGVTRDKVLQVAKSNGFKIVEQDIPLKDLANYDGAFLISTSSKILPINSIDDHVWKDFPHALTELVATFNTFLAEHSESQNT